MHVTRALSLIQSLHGLTNFAPKPVHLILLMLICKLNHLMAVDFIL